MPQTEDKLQPFDDFLRDVEGAQHGHYRHRAAARVRSATAFEEQKAYLLHRYRGVEVAHSFVDEHGQVFDCMPVEQQPALKASGGQPASPPSTARPVPPGEPAGPSAITALGRDRRDRDGRIMACPPGTVPIRRVTLDDLTRFETLGHFLRKYPRRPRQPSRPAAPLASPEAAGEPQHHYAHAFQEVDNHGGHSVFNVWAPRVTGDQVFTLAQQWFVANGGSTVRQTVEVGWHVFPQLYGHASPVLFTYWTADNYASTGGYNTTNFVQTSPTHVVGMPLSQVSVAGGAQAEVDVAFTLFEGNWWLYVDGNPVGYYPGSLFNNGPLATGANEIDFGGETVGSLSFPAMGSGAFADQGFKRAAYQRNIYYYTPAGGAEYARLSPDQQWPNQYTIVPQDSGDWGEYIYFGGPGTVASAEAPSINFAGAGQPASDLDPALQRTLETLFRPVQSGERAVLFPDGVAAIELELQPASTAQPSSLRLKITGVGRPDVSG